LRPENLIARHQDQCHEALQSTPEKIFQDVLAPVAAALSAAGPPAATIAAIVAAMDQYEKLLGIPELCRDATHRNMELGSLERTLLEVSAGLADRCDQKLAEVVVGLIEAPRYRLAGAEEALRAFNVVAEKRVEDPGNAGEGTPGEGRRDLQPHPRIHEAGRQDGRLAARRRRQRSGSAAPRMRMPPSSTCSSSSAFIPRRSSRPCSCNA